MSGRISRTRTNQPAPVDPLDGLNPAIAERVRRARLAAQIDEEMRASELSSDRARRRRPDAASAKADLSKAGWVEARLADGLQVLVAWAASRPEAMNIVSQIRFPLQRDWRPVTIQVEGGSALMDAVAWLEMLQTPETRSREALPDDITAIIYWRSLGKSWRAIATGLSDNDRLRSGRSHESIRKHFNQAIAVICARLVR